jgi:hypothetical protein
VKPVDDFYSTADVEDYFEEDEMNTGEYGFMIGYLGEA